VSTKKLPEIAPCPRPGCRGSAKLHSSLFSMKFVFCSCGWEGPMSKTERGAILTWNRRADAEAERRGAMAAVEWFRKRKCRGAASVLEAAIERGEVLRAKGKPR
jgi:hypothetical protein